MANPKGNPQSLKPFKPTRDKAFDTRIGFMYYEERVNKLKSIPNWTDKLRDAIDKLIDEELGPNN